MSKAIKVSDEVYIQLGALMERRDTFSDVVSKLLKIQEQVDLLFTALEGATAYRKWQAEKRGGVEKHG